MGHFGHILDFFFLCIVNRRRMGMERWKKIRQGNKKCRGAWCVLLHELGPGIARLFGSFFFVVSTFFGVERGGIGGFGVFDIHTSYLHCTSGMVGVAWSATRQ